MPLSTLVNLTIKDDNGAFDYCGFIQFGEITPLSALESAFQETDANQDGKILTIEVFDEEAEQPLEKLQKHCPE